MIGRPYPVSGYRLSSPSSLLFVLFLGAATFFAILGGAAGIGVRLQERSVRQEDPSFRSMAQARPEKTAQTPVLAPRSWPDRTQAPSRIAAGAREDGLALSIAPVGAVVVLPPSRAPPARGFARA